MRLVVALCVVALAACTGEHGAGDDDVSTSANTGTDAGPSSGTATGGSGGVGSGGAGGAGGDPQIAAVCSRWLADRANLDEGSWSGNVTGCNAGDISAQGRANALTQVNLYRFIAQLPAVVTDPTRDQKTQDCALMLDANMQLSHTPPMSWACYTADGDEAAGNSNIASGPGVMAVDMYMSDFGNGSTMGHRRWILSNSLGPIGLGSTNNYSCMWVIQGSGMAGKPWLAWPSPGIFPIEALTTSFQSVDETGWTIQSNSIDLSGAQVALTEDGNARTVQVSGLAGGYGSTYAIKINPQGWASQAGSVYDVSVTGISPSIDYQVQMVACE